MVGGGRWDDGSETRRETERSPQETDWTLHVEVFFPGGWLPCSLRCGQDQRAANARSTRFVLDNPPGEPSRERGRGSPQVSGLGWLVLALSSLH